MVGHMIALLLGARLVQRYGMDRLLGAGAVLAAVAGLTAAGLGWASASSWNPTLIVFTIALPVALFMIAFAIIIPASVAGSMAPFGDKAGAAASLMGFLQFAGAALVATLIALFSDGSHTAMVSAIGAAGVAVLIFWMGLVRPLANGKKQPRSSA